MMMGQLDSVSVSSGQHHFRRIGNLDAMGDIKPQHFFIEVDGLFKIRDIDAVLIDTGFHDLASLL